jgi:predicted RNA-binding protein with PIN domain
VDALLAELDELQQQDLEPAKQQVLDQLYEYAEMVVPQE